ncbi:MAG: CPBP family intramembrane metalloprotease [Planctomycetaceae bacterium]|nr:CPBP family intramembrane metalloprotease [Planctomycetaceae bacterium]
MAAESSGEGHVSNVPGPTTLQRMARKSKSDYWQQSRLPWPSLVFLTPMLVAYEVGVLWVGGRNSAEIRSGADIWLRGGLEAIGLGVSWLPPLLVVLGLLVWQWVEKHPWRVSWETLAGMFAESVIFAFILLLIGQLQSRVFSWSMTHSHDVIDVAGLTAAMSPAAAETLARALGFVGAGIYEEVLFRLALLPPTMTLLRQPSFLRRWATPVAVLITSLLFSAAHHAGPSGEPFDLFRFTFRALAGGIFAALFVLRGFGITAASHALYDLLVGVLLVE